MYIITEQNGIINLDHYPRVNVYPNQNSYFICAFTVPDQVKVGNEKIAITKYDKPEDADYAFCQLIVSLQADVPIWDATKAERLSDLWNQIKQDCSGNLVKDAEISIAIPNKITITYSWGLDLESRSDEREMVEDKLKKTLKVLDFDPPHWVQKSSK